MPVGSGRLTVEAFLMQWVDEVLPGRARVRSSNTVDNYRWAAEKHLIPALGKKALWTLSPDDVEGLLRSMAADGRSRSAVMRVRAVLVHALTHA